MKAALIILWILFVASGIVVIYRYPARPTPAAATIPIAEQRTAEYLESIRNQPDKLQSFLKDMPKGADLHTHLSGAVYAETYLSWAAQNKLCIDSVNFTASDKCGHGQVKLNEELPKNDPVFYRKVIDAWSTRNWEHSGKTGHDQFFEAFRRWGPLTARTGEMLAEIRARAAAGNVSYLEIMITPDGGESRQLGDSLTWSEDFGAMRQQLLKAGLVDKVVASAKQILDQAEQRAGEVLRCSQPQAEQGCAVEVRYIFQVGRTNAPPQVFAQMVAAFELANHDPRVVALNLVQPEDNLVALRDFSLQMRMLNYLRQIYRRAHITLHAGELAQGLVPPEALRFHITESVTIGNAERIGHGVDVMYETNADKLLQEMAARNVMVEICLTSNDVILGVRGDQHPLRRYIAAGVPVALATDDEGVARSDITNEYRKAVADQRLGYSELKKMARTSLEHAFVPGQSLWANRNFELTPQCTNDRPTNNTLSSQCEQFLNGNRKASLQWTLEKSLAVFESQSR